MITVGKRYRLPLAILLGAWVVRVLYLISIHRAWFFDHLQTEPQHYDEWARAILDGSAPVHLPFDEAPAYPYVVAAIYGVFDRSVLAVAVVQALLDAASCAAIAVVARRLAGERAGWIAGGIAAVYAPLIYFTGQLEPATLAVFAVAAAAAATPTGQASAARWTIAGIAWAAAITVRSELVVAIPVVVVYAWRCGGRPVRAAAPAAALLAASLSLNAIVGGHAVLLTTGSGVNLWLGNNAEADGVNPFPHGPQEPIAADIMGTSPDAVEADGRFRHLALEFVTEHPGAALSLAAKKLVWTFAQRELPNAADIDWQTRQSWLFAVPGFPLGFGVVFPLAVAGVWLARGKLRKGWFLAGPVLAALAACVVMFTNARFRLVMMPSVLVVAALAVDELVAWRREHVRALALVALGATLAWANFFDVRHYRISQIDTNTGVLERGAGHYASAARHFQIALRGDPGDAGAWIGLALSLEDAGRRDEARTVWARALRQLPDDPVVRQAAQAHLR